MKTSSTPLHFFFVPFSCPVIRAHNAMTKEISLFFLSLLSYRSNSLQLANILLPTDYDNDDNDNNNNNNNDELIYTRGHAPIIY